RLDHAVGDGERTGVAGGDVGDVAQRLGGNLHRVALGRGGADAELAVPVVSPDPDVAVLVEREHAIPARVDLHDPGQLRARVALHEVGSGRRRGATQRAVPGVAPGDDAALT